MKEVRNITTNQNNQNVILFVLGTVAVVIVAFVAFVLLSWFVTFVLNHWFGIIVGLVVVFAIIVVLGFAFGNQAPKPNKSSEGSD